MLRNYDDTALQLFEKSLRGSRKVFRELLQRHPELAAFSNSLKGDEKARKWLEVRGSAEMHALVESLFHEQEAFMRLQQLPDKLWVSLSLACQNRPEGIFWMQKNGFGYALPLCKKIHEALDILDKERTFWYRIFH